MQKTLQQLINDTERLLYQAVGSGVQVYSQDNLAQKVQQAFETIFKAKFWPQFLVREVRTLNGTTGKVTAPFTSILEWGDVFAIFRAGSRSPIPQLPYSFNTLNFSGPYAKYADPASDNTLFTLYPLTSTGQIVVVGRAGRTTEFTLTDIVPFDYLALEYHAAWSYMIDDASNPAMVEKFQTQFSNRIKQLWENAQTHVVKLNPQSGEIPRQWYEK